MAPRIGMALALALLLVGCATVPGEPIEPERFEVRHEEDRVIYRGSMSGEAIAQVRHLLEQGDGQIRWLDIESGGGNVDWGLDLGELVMEYQLNVRAFGIGCHSSCANYVFTAGERKVIDKGAVVTWHGSALQRNWGFRDRLRRAFRPAFRAQFDEWRDRQADFFERIGVDERVTIVGQDLGCGCTWALSVGDMARFGLSDVEAPESYTETDLSGFPDRFRVRFLELPDDVFERIRDRGDA